MIKMTNENIINPNKLLMRIRRDVLGKDETKEQLQELEISIEETKDSIYTAHLHAIINIYEPIYSHRKFIGPILVFFRKIFRKFARFHVSSLTNQQISFNNAMVSALHNVMETTNARLDILEERLHALEKNEL